MAATDIAAWLRALGLERYEQAFRASDIDADVLTELSEADLEKLGVSLGHRKKLLKAIAELRAATAAARDLRRRCVCSRRGRRRAPAGDGAVLRPGRVHRA